MLIKKNSCYISVSLSLSFDLLVVRFEQTTLKHFVGLFRFLVIRSLHPLVPSSSKASIHLQKVHLIVHLVVRTVQHLCSHTFLETNHLLRQSDCGLLENGCRYVIQQNRNNSTKFEERLQFFKCGLHDLLLLLLLHLRFFLRLHLAPFLNIWNHLASLDILN